MSTVGLLATSIWFVVGFFLLAAALRSRRASKRFHAVARPTTATLIGIEDDTSTYIDGDGITHTSTSSVARVRFRTADGREVVAKGAIGRTSPSPTPGASIDIRYDPDNPSSIRLGESGTSGGGSAVLFVVAILTFLAGFVFAASF